MKIYQSEIVSKNYSGEFGEIVGFEKNGFLVKTGDGALLITEIKPFGKKRMDASSYLNGIHKDTFLGKVFQ